MKPSATFPTGRFVVLDHDFGVRTPHPGLTRYIESSFGALARPGEPRTWYDLIIDAGGAQRYALLHDGEIVIRTYDPARAVMSLAWHVNQQVIRNPDHVIVHAAAAEQNGVGVVLTGEMEAGKTTLVTGLLRRGFRYLTDEAVLIEPETLLAHPYHKPLSIDQGSWELFPDLRPDVPQELSSYITRQWQVAPTTVAPDSLAAATRPRVLIRTRYVPGSSTRIEPVRKSAMLQVLLEQTFHVTADGLRAFRVLGDLVRTSDCYDMTTADLDAACALIIDAWKNSLVPEVARS